VFEALLDAPAHPFADSRLQMIDDTIVRAHLHAAGAKSLFVPTRLAIRRRSTSPVA
jgi:hypothetical protein